MKVTLVRHGQTIENATGIIQGQARGTLNDVGKAQVRKLAERLKDERFDLVFCSDLERARHTAKEIMMHHDNEIIFTELVRERDMGEFHSKTSEEFYEAMDESGKSVIDFRPDGGENYHDVRKRSAGFVRDLQKHEGKNILVVAHGMVNRLIIAELVGLSTEESARINQENTCVNIIESTGNGNELKVLNDFSHLS